MTKRTRKEKYQVRKPNSLHGPKFSSKWDALKYIAHFIEDDHEALVLVKLEGVR